MAMLKAPFPFSNFRRRKQDGLFWHWRPDCCCYPKWNFQPKSIINANEPTCDECATQMHDENERSEARFAVGVF